MKFDIKSIHVGNCISRRVDELEVTIPRICKFLNTTEIEIYKMYQQQSLDTDILLKWSKLLEYDFFRIYTQHLIIFAPQGSQHYNVVPQKKQSSLPQFRKNIYTKELIDFILELIDTGQKSKFQIIDEYGIPKTTLYKWMDKYRKV
ncbi:transposase [Chryseobacterium sp. PMSZPI]|uniref:transposase n=1 Tax=Chryseobacterium sp. PMSZPI TaxID=1033900 RepID=UPI000C3330FE|nr:transposase [Chryseobacterium sp. PMSZPI]PKF75438.1 transposase [Chryseobacterium sp. PMSZPI]